MVTDIDSSAVATAKAKPITRGVLAELHQLFELISKPANQRSGELMAYAKAIKFTWMDPEAPTGVEGFVVPATGFFGLELPAIRLRLEGLQGIERFALSTGSRARPQVYRLSCLLDDNVVAREAGVRRYDDIMRSLVSELQADKGSRGGLDLGVARATACVASERYHWAKHEQGLDQLKPGELTGPMMNRQPVTSAESMAVDGETDTPAAGSVNMTSLAMNLLANDYVSPGEVGGTVSSRGHSDSHAPTMTLFLPGISTAEGEKLLSVWDFLDATRTLIGDVLMGFTDVMKAVIPPPAMFPTISQVVFDELGCLFAGLLHDELKVTLKVHRPSFAWYEIVAARPINLVTWPFVVREILSVMLPVKLSRGLFNHDEAFELLRRPAASKDEAVMLDLLCLLAHHPLIGDMLTLSSTPLETVDHPLIGDMLTLSSTPLETVDFDVDADGDNDGGSVNIKDKVMSSLLASSFGNADEVDADYCYASLSDFVSDISKILNDNATRLPQECACIRKWFRGVLCNYRLPELASEIPDIAVDVDTSELKMSINFNHVMGTVTDTEKLSSDFGFGSFYGSSGVELATHIQPDIKKPYYASGGAYDAAMLTLGSLERCLQMLLMDDTETYPKEGRVDLLFLLMNVVSRGDNYKEALARKTVALTNGKIIPLASNSSSPTPNPPPAVVAGAAVAVPRTSSASGARDKLIMTANGAMKDSSFIQEVPREPVVPPVIRIVPSPDSSVKCCFTGLGPADVDSSELFVEVPPEFVPDAGNGGGSSMDIETHATVYGLKSVLLRVAAARELAVNERNIVSASRLDKFNRLLSGEVMHSPGSFLAIGAKLTGSCRYLNSAPLGHDRHGCEYWLIGCQETYSLGCFNKIGGNATSPDNVTDPTLLVRDTKGHWFKLASPTLNAHQVLRELFSNHLSDNVPCERGLRNAIIDRLFAVKQRIGSGLFTYKNMQVTEWFAHQRTFEKWVHHLHLNMDQILGSVTNNPKEIVRLMELVFARCCESRSLLHCGSMIREDMARFGDPYALRTDRHVMVRLKRLRDFVLEESAECHHVKGWQRSDALSRTREISCSTLASRMLSDAGLYQVVQFQMRRVRHRKPELKPELVAQRPPTPATAPASATATVTASTATATAPAPAATATATVTAPAPDMSVESKPTAALATPAPLTSGTREWTIEERQALFAQQGGGMNCAHPALMDVRVTKGVEQMNRKGEVIHRYSSGKDAALSMQVSQGGISLCCTGTKPDAYGFLWRFYVGRHSDCKWIFHPICCVS